MEALFKTWKTSRKLYLNFFERYTEEQLNMIPEGFNNNLIWNMGHVVVAQQSLIYKLSGLRTSLSADFITRYQPGSKPEERVGSDEIAAIKRLLAEQVDQTVEDYEQGRFVAFTERMTGTGFHLASLQDALEFNNYHEGLHLGIMMGLRKFV
jgi:hypothetical protein